MPYCCLDCSFSGKHFPAGACPACGSLRVEGQQKTEQKQVRKPLQLAFLIVLWLYLIYMIIDKL